MPKKKSDWNYSLLKNNTRPALKTGGIFFSGGIVNVKGPVPAMLDNSLYLPKQLIGKMNENSD